MEADIIAEGFARSMDMHIVKYNNLVGDGDSSVMKKLKLKNPYGIGFMQEQDWIQKSFIAKFLPRNEGLGKKKQITM